MATGWQGWAGTHFQVTVADNQGKAAAKQVVSGFTAKKGGAMQFGIDSSKGGWKAQLLADVQALIPDMLGIKLKGAVIAANDVTPLVASVIHNNAKVS